MNEGELLQRQVRQTRASRRLCQYFDTFLLYCEKSSNKSTKRFLFTTTYNWSEKHRVDWTAGGSSGRWEFFLMVLIYDFEAMEWTKIMSVDDLTCLRWPCLPHILASHWTIVTILAPWLAAACLPSSLIISRWCLDPDTINWLVSSSLEFSSCALGYERRGDLFPGSSPLITTATGTGSLGTQ